MTCESDVELDERFWADVELNTPQPEVLHSITLFHQPSTAHQVNSPETAGSNCVTFLA